MPRRTTFAQKIVRYARRPTLGLQPHGTKRNLGRAVWPRRPVATEPHALICHWIVNVLLTIIPDAGSRRRSVIYIVCAKKASELNQVRGLGRFAPSPKPRSHAQRNAFAAKCFHCVKDRKVLSRHQ